MNFKRTNQTMPSFESPCLECLEELGELFEYVDNWDQQ
jgi:hypothetical protein